MNKNNIMAYIRNKLNVINLQRRIDMIELYIRNNLAVMIGKE